MSGFESNKPVGELFPDAWKRIDGVTMYVICGVYTLLGLYFGFGISEYVSLPEILGKPKGDWAYFAGVPFTFISYIGFAMFSSDNSRTSQLINAACLVGCCIYLLINLLY